MDAGIILGGQQPDILGAMDKGRAMAESQIGLNRQNALAELYRTQGAQIAAGDQNALNALAGFDPNASLGVQGNILGIQAQKQNMAFSAEEMQMKRDAAKASATEALAAQQDKLTAGQLAAEAKAMSDALSGAAFFYQNKDEAGYNAFLQKSGIDPAEFPFAEFPAHAASVEGVLEAMKTFQPAEMNPNERFKVAGGTIFDLAAEGGPKPVGQGAMQETMVMGPDGKPIMVQGGPGTTAKFTEAQGKDNAFATRAQGALEKLESPTQSGTVADDLASLQDRAAGALPVVGNYLQSDAYQTAKTAGDEFLQAILRKDTGAAITPGEQSLYGETYLPQPGDGAPRLAYKKEARLRAVEAIKSGMNAAQLEAMARADAAVVSQLAKDGGAAPEKPAPTGKATEMSDEDFLKAMGLE